MNIKKLIIENELSNKEELNKEELNKEFKINKSHTLKLLDFNCYDTIDEDNYNKYKDSKKFVVQMFGINKHRQTFSLLIDDFKPYFYVEVPNEWTKKEKNSFATYFKTKIGNYYENSVISFKFAKRKKLYMFDNSEYYKFIIITFANNTVFNKAKNLWYISGKNKDGEYSKKLNPNNFEYKDNGITYNLKLYEAQIPPLLRLFHKNNISPSGWIKFEVNKAFALKSEFKKTKCKYEYNISFRDIYPLPEKNTLVPYKILSFDIEASSSHGDFPVPIKDYKKLGDDLLQFNNFTKSHYDINTLKRAINTAFGFDNLPNINKVYTKNNVTQEEINNLFDIWINKSISDIKKLKSTNNNYDDNNYEDEDESSDDDFNGVNNEDNNEGYVEIEAKYITKKTVKEYKNKTKKDDLIKIIDILNDHDAEYKSKLKILIRSFYIFPDLEGDKCTFIGYTFRNYGEKNPYLKYCGVLNGCVIEKNNDSINIKSFEKRI